MANEKAPFHKHAAARAEDDPGQRIANQQQSPRKSRSHRHHVTSVTAGGCGTHRIRSATLFLTRHCAHASITAPGNLSIHHYGALRAQ